MPLHWHSAPPAADRRLKHRDVVSFNGERYMVVVDGGARLTPYGSPVIPACKLEAGERVRVGTRTYRVTANSSGMVWLRDLAERMAEPYRRKAVEARKRPPGWETV